MKTLHFVLYLFLTALRWDRASKRFEQEQADLLAQELNFTYSHDTLTGVYNRSQYEKDLHSLSHSNYRCITCLYLDTLGSTHYHTAIGVQTADHPSGLAATIHDAELAMRKAKE